KGLGGLEVDDQLEFCRLLDGQLRGFLAFENTSGIDTELTVGLGTARPIAHQTTGPGKVTSRVHRGRPITGRKGDDFIGPSDEKRGGGNQKRAGLPDRRSKGGVEVVVSANIENKELHAKRMRRFL